MQLALHSKVKTTTTSDNHWKSATSP